VVGGSVIEGSVVGEALWTCPVFRPRRLHLHLQPPTKNCHRPPSHHHHPSPSSASASSLSTDDDGIRDRTAKVQVDCLRLVETQENYQICTVLTASEASSDTGGAEFGRDQTELFRGEFAVQYSEFSIPFVLFGFKLYHPKSEETPTSSPTPDSESDVHK
jgi:hypothetical protein